VFLGIAEVLLEFLVKIAEGMLPVFFAFFNLVEFFLEASGVRDVKNVGEVLDQEISYHQANFRGRELAPYLLHVLAFQDRAQDRRIG
jgi:hypothetical protein